MIVTAVAVALIVAGFFFFLATSIGIIRFPDFYTRLHAAGKGDTLSTVLILSGLALYHLNHFSGSTVLVSIKIMFIAVFIFMASPAASHAILDAGFHSGAEPWVQKDGKKKGEKE